MSKLWQTAKGGGALHPDIDRFLWSLPTDRRLFKEDLEASAAHAAMLGDSGIIPKVQAEALTAELGAMLEEARAGSLVPDEESEDVHSFLEAELTRRLGEAGKAVHAGRSRNDQVATAFRLYLRRSYQTAMSLIQKALSALLDLAERNVETLMPGYTHLQRAQPLSLAHHLLAWCAGLERDLGRFRDGLARADECPLGSGALAGSGLPVDREATARTLGFSRPGRNTMDGVGDRDAFVEYAAAAASLMVRLSRASEDIALWASAEYGFIRVGDSASTGSSIMPQKRNPDPAELIRGKAARVLGGLQALLVLQKGLPYAYNRDLQEDKDIFFDLEEATLGSLRAFSALTAALEPDTARMRAALEAGFLEATDVAEYLVRAGIPFRTAYQAAKELVARCLEQGRRPAAFSDAELRSLHPAYASAFESGASGNAAEFAAYLSPAACVDRRSQTGGPAPLRVREEIARLRDIIA